MRRFALPLLLVLASCGGEPVEEARGETIECRLAGQGAFAPVCTIERVRGDAGVTLTVRKPDGGFRRLAIATDGHGVIAADGAERAQVSMAGNTLIDVAIGGDTFRLPATVQPRR